MIRYSYRITVLAVSMPTWISDSRHEHPFEKVATGKYECAFCLSDGLGVSYFCETCSMTVHASCIKLLMDEDAGDDCGSFRRHSVIDNR